LQMPNREQDALGFGSGSIPFLAEAIGECLLLLDCLQFGEQKRMAYADFLGIERLDHGRGKLGQTDSLRTICGRFSNLRSDLFDAVLRVFQVEQRFKALRLLQRVNVAALQVFDLSLVLQKQSMTSTTAHFTTLWNR